MPSGRSRKDSTKSVKRNDSVEHGQVESNGVTNGSGNDVADYKKYGCCSPSGCLVGEIIDTEDPEDAVRVQCNNQDCTVGNFMHKVCFDNWEGSVLTFLRNTGRARSWSEKQRQQNLWTKKGYDLAFKACDCLCKRGHLCKDLDYIQTSLEEQGDKKKRNRKKSNSNKPQLPTLNNRASSNNPVLNQMNGGAPSSVPSSVHQQQYPAHNGAHSSPPENGLHQMHCTAPSQQQPTLPEDKELITTTTVGIPLMRQRTTSQCSGLSFQQHSPGGGGSGGYYYHHPHQHGSSMHSTASNPSRIRGRAQSFGSSTISSAGSPPSSGPHSLGAKSSVSSLGSRFGAIDLYQVCDEWCGWVGIDQDQIESNGSIFQRRTSFSKFCEALPKWKINRYHIKMEDDCPQGNDDTRCFLLTSLGDNKITEVTCVICRASMVVYDRYPLLDGCFFLSSYNYGCLGIRVKWDGDCRYLFATCVNCLANSSGLYCCECKSSNWFRGDSLQLGTMYSYDVLAVFPCACKKACTQCGYQFPSDVGELAKLATFSSCSEPFCCPDCGSLEKHCASSSRLDTCRLVRKNSVLA